MPFKKKTPCFVRASGLLASEIRGCAGLSGSSLPYFAHISVAYILSHCHISLCHRISCIDDYQCVRKMLNNCFIMSSSPFNTKEKTDLVLQAQADAERLEEGLTCVYSVMSTLEGCETGVFRHDYGPKGPRGKKHWYRLYFPVEINEPFRWLPKNAAFRQAERQNAAEGLRGV